MQGRSGSRRGEATAFWCVREMDEAREDDEGRVNPAWDLDDWVANITQASAEQAIDEVPRNLRKAPAGHDGEEWRTALDVELNKFK